MVEVQINHFDSVCWYMGCTSKQNEKRAEELHEFCTYCSSERYPFDVGLKKIVGVFNPDTSKWVRGQVIQIYERVNETEYKVMLLDYGEIRIVKKRHMVQLNGLWSYPKQCLKIGLDGVIPDVSLCTKCKVLLTGLFHKGKIYFKETRKIEDMVFGEITIVPMHGDEANIDLTTFLLSKGMVKKSENFEKDVEELFCRKDETDQASSKRINSSEAKERKVKEHTSQKEDRTSASSSSSSSKANPDTGYSSADSHSQFVHEDAIFLPAGFHDQSSKKSDNRHSSRSREPEKMPRTYYQILFDQNKKAEHRSKSLGRSVEKTQSQITSKSSTRDQHNSNRQPQEPKSRSSLPSHFKTEESSSENRPVFETKRVSWSSSSYHCDASNQAGEGQSNRKKIRAFNLNLKPKENRVPTGSEGNIAGQAKLNANIGSIDGQSSNLQPSEVKSPVGNDSLSEKKVETVIKSSNNSPTPNTNTLNVSTGSSASESDVPFLSKAKLWRLEQLAKKAKAEKEGKNTQQAEINYNTGLIDGESTNFQSSEVKSPVGSESLPEKKVETVLKSSINTINNSPTPNTNTLNVSTGSLENESDVPVLSKGKLWRLEQLAKKSTQQSRDENVKPEVMYQQSKKESVLGSSFNSETNECPDKDNSLNSSNNSLYDCPVSSPVVNLSTSSFNSSVNSLKTPNTSNVSVNNTSSHNSSMQASDKLNLSNCSSKSGRDLSSLSKRQLLMLRQSKTYVQPEYFKEHDSTRSDVDHIKIAVDQDSVKSRLEVIQKQPPQGDEKFSKLKQTSNDIGSYSLQSDALRSSTSHNYPVTNDDGSHIYISEKVERHKKMNELMAPTEEQVKQNEFDYTSEMRNYSSQSLMRSIKAASGVLVHTEDGQVIPPIANLSESCLDVKIIRRMELLNLRELNRIQTFSYPTILARRNIAMISPAGSGKTAGYVVPLASNLLDYDFYLKLPSGHGPRVVIITPFWESGQTAKNMFTSLNTANIVQTYGGGAELERKHALLSGCDVLVSTPRCILRILDYGVTNLKRLCHLVLDDADVLFDKFKPEMEKVIVLVDKMELEREKLKINMELQVVITAKTWTNPLKYLVTKILTNPTICIASQLEACVYAGIKPTAIFVKGDKKMEKVVEILKHVDGKKRTVVMCRSKKDVKYVYDLLRELDMKNVLVAHEDLSSVNISELPKSWNKERVTVDTLWERSSVCMPVLIRSDEVLDEYPVKNAEVLIHYNMPKSLKTFNLRFTCLLDNYCNVLKKEVSHKKCEVFILMDEDNDLETPEVMTFMTKLGTVLPESVQQTIEKINQLREEKKVVEPVCETLKEFGQCWNIKKCPYRHIVSAEHDLQQDMPQSGWVKILVQHVHDACHFSVRLLEHAQNKNDWKKLSTDMMILSMKLNNFYGKETNRRLHGLPSIGDIVAVESSVGVYQRAVVLKITSYNKRNEPLEVNLRLIDNGSFRYDYQVVQLYGLPDELRSPPPGVVDVYLCNIMPTDLDISWSQAMKNWVQKELKEAHYSSPNGYLVGKIVLSVGRNLWLEPLEYLEYLPGVDTTVFRFSLRQDLINKYKAIENPEHITNLRKLCQKAGIEIQEEEEEVKPKSLLQPKPSWAWLPQDYCEHVHVVTIEAPNVIFLRIAYFYDCLKKLVEEIQTYMKDKKNYLESVKELKVGDICLGKSPGGDEWNRAMVLGKPCDGQMKLFFVDYGDFATVSLSEVAPIANEHITKLHFQVIECYLAGVQFEELDIEGWEDDLIDGICDFTRNSNEECKDLQAKVCGVESVGMLSQGRRYKIVLADNSSDQVTIINKELISSGIAQSLEKDAHLIEICKEELDQTFQKKITIDSEPESDIENEPQCVSPSNIDIITTVQSENHCQVLLPEDFNLNDKVTVDEKEQRVLQFLRDVDKGNFEYSGFPVDKVEQSSENDADISENENHSEGSVLSLPQSRGSLPQTIGSIAKFYPEKASLSGGQDSDANGGIINSLHHGSLLSLNEEMMKKHEVVLDKECLETLSTSSLQSLKEDRFPTEIADHSNQSSMFPINTQKGKTCEILNQKYLESALPSTLCVQSSAKCDSGLDSNSLRENQFHEGKTETYIVLNQEYLESAPDHAPCAQSSPKNATSFCTPFNTLSPVSLPSTTPLAISIPRDASTSVSLDSPCSSSSKSKITGKVNCFADYFPISLYDSPVSSSTAVKLNLLDKIKPFVNSVSCTYNIENTNNNTNEREDHKKEFMKFDKNVSKESDKSISVSLQSDNSGMETSKELEHLHTSTGTVIIEQKSSFVSSNDNSIRVIKEKVQSLSGKIIKEKERNEVKNETPSRKWVVVKVLTDSEEELAVNTSDNHSFEEKDRSEENVCEKHPTNSKSDKQIADVETISLETRHPLVRWHQNDKFVWIHIKLPSLKHYNFSCDINSIEFSAVYEKLPYRVSLTLFAGHREDKVQCYPRAFYFEVRLHKLMEGKKYFWPRLTESEEKFHWLKMNVEKACQDIDESEDEDTKRWVCSLPLWNDNPGDTESLNSDVSEIANSELSAMF